MTIKQGVALTDKVIQGKGNIVSDMGGEKVMLSVANGKYYNLGEMGGEIWDLIWDTIEVKQITAVLLANYQVEQTECEEQVISFLNHLFNEGLIEIVNGKM